VFISLLARLWSTAAEIGALGLVYLTTLFEKYRSFR